MNVVLANGCFDPLHPGHIEHLEMARSAGDRLIVSLTLDTHVNKGPNRPYLKWNERRAMLVALRCVDGVIASKSAWDAIREVRPTIFVKGEDWDGRLPDETVRACADVGASIMFTRTPRFGVDELVRRMKA